MAHDCPECGQACYCNGDIDDCYIPDHEAELACTCCICEDCGWPHSECACIGPEDREGEDGHED